MKRFCTYLVLCLTAVCGFACTSEPVLTFESPQPQSVNPEKQFSPKVWGTYLSTVDSSFLLVSAQYLVRLRVEKETYSKKSLALDSVEYKIENGRIYTPDLEEGHTVLWQTSDSIGVVLSYADTIFSLADQNQLRQFRGMYFLNQQQPDQRWEVFCLEPGKKKSLQLRWLSDSADVAELKKLGLVREQEEALVANPSKKELRQFLKEGGFRNTETFRPYTGSKDFAEAELINLTGLDSFLRNQHQSEVQ